MKPFSLKARFFSGLVVISVLLITSAVISGLMLRSAITSIERLSTQAIPASYAAMGAAQTGAQIAADIPLLATARDSYERQAAQIALEQTLTRFRQHLSDLRQLGGHDGMTGQIATLAEALSSEAQHINALVHRLSDVRAGTGRADDTEAALTAALQDSFARARSASTRLSSFVYREVMRYQAETRRRLEETRAVTFKMQILLLGLGGVAVFIFMPFLWVYLGGRVVEPIVDLAAMARRLAAGDLTGEPPPRARDEIGDLAEGLTMARDAMIGLREVNEKLRRQGEDLMLMAITDPLTGVGNRRRFSDVAQAELDRSRRHGKSLSVILMDLDHFKSVNDLFGHDVGDQVLIRTAVVLSDVIRSTDLLCRHGGEEFIILLPEETRDGATILAERARAAVAAQVLTTPEGQDVRWTLSVGVASLCDDDLSVEDIVRRADVAMYCAKAAGRNRVEIAA